MKILRRIGRAIIMILCVPIFAWIIFCCGVFVQAVGELVRILFA